MHVWKATTVVFACTSVWLAWLACAEENEPRRPIAEAFESFAEARDEIEVESASSNHDAIAAIRAGEVELAERSLEDPRPRVSRAAVEALFRAGASDVLIDAIHEDAPEWRVRRIVDVLGWIADERSVRTLSSLLDGDDGVHVEAWRLVEALGTTASPAALPALRRYVERANDPGVLDRALAAVAYLAIPEADRALLEWARAPGMLGQHALSRLDPENEAALPLLRAALEEQPSRVYAACQSLSVSDDALHAELTRCIDRRDDGRVPCFHVLAVRGEVDLVARRLDGRGDLEHVAWGLAKDEEGREVLERLRHSRDYETRRIALTALAERSDSARADLVAMANEGSGATRLQLGIDLLHAGAAEGVELVVDAVLGNATFARHHGALVALANNEEHGVPALRDLARSADGIVAQQARAQLLRRPRLDDADVDVLADALADGDSSIVNQLRADELPTRVRALLESHLDDPETRALSMQILARRIPASEAARLAASDAVLQAVVLHASPHDDPALDALVQQVAREHRDPAALVDVVGDAPAVQRYLRDSLDELEDRDIAFGLVAGQLPSDELESYTRDSDASIRRQALTQLSNRNGPEAARGGLAAIGDSDPAVRVAAIDALASSSDPAATRALIGATRDQDDDVAISAIGTLLNTVGGETLPDIVDLAFDPYYSLQRRQSIATHVLSSSHDIDDATRDALREIAGQTNRRNPRVIVLDEI